MEYRKLGRTDIEVSAVCQGCWSIVTKDWTWGGTPLQQAVEALQTAFAAGINFFDTAEGYGPGGQSEEILAEAFKDMRREELVIATKVSPKHFEPAQVREACENSLKRLNTDYVDLYQLHWPNATVPLADTLGAMQQLKAEGKIRAVGVSNFGVSYMNELLEMGRAESNQIAYSLLFRPPEAAVQPLCVDNDISILCYSPLCWALLTGKFASADEVPESRARTRHFSSDRPHTDHGEPGCEGATFAALDRIREICAGAGVSMSQAALAWLLSRPGVTSAIAGGRSPEQVRDNAAAGDLKLSRAVLDALTAASQPVRSALGENCDMWQVPSRMERQ